MARSTPVKSTEPVSESASADAALAADQEALAHIRRLQNEAAREITLDRLAARDPAIAELVARTRADAARIAQLEAELAALRA